MFAKIKTCTTAKEIWEKLTQLCEGNDQTKENKLTVAIQKFDNVKIKLGETLVEFDERFNGIIIELISLGKDYSNLEIPLKVMRALPREWDVKTIAMRESKDLNNLELHDLFADLKTFEFELGIRTEEETSTSQQTKTLAATTVTLPIEESTSKKSAEQLSNEAMSLFVKIFSKFMRKNQSQMNKPHFNKDHNDDGQACFNYGKKGHFIAECNRPRKDEKKSSDRRRVKENKRFSKKKSQRVLVAEEDKGKWAESDSEKSIFEEYSSESEDEKVECLMAIEDQESTDENVFDFNSDEFTREDLVTALHDMVNEFKRLSQQFNEVKTEKQNLENKLTLFSCSQQKEVDSLRVKLSLLTAENDDRRRLFDATLKENKRLINTINTWNKSSVSLNRMHEMQKPVGDRTGLGYGINECSTLLEKDSLKPIKFVTKKKKLEESIWFLDSGCSRHMTGNKVLLSEIVNYRGPTITFGDNSKGKVVGKDHGIKHELSAAISPQQNGVDERRIRTLKEASRTMLAESSISQRFWAEAINTACYTQNRSMINKNHEKTPYEIWTGKQPEVGYFRIFGCKCFIHINGKTHLTAFDVKADNDVKSAFLNGLLNEKLHAEQPPGFVNHTFPAYVYKLDKALYGLKQAPRAWYDTLTKFLLEHGFTIETVDITLFRFSKNNHSLFVQIYVDDIIFGSTNPKLCERFTENDAGVI
ncbi:uncharacterized protein LOC142541977 [Primulina tabacum]|uniref:uncharacterized protein LOC142541977 n=1 Tax=Primulina tabacum TaxID=48773 RepID=UPI003F5A5DCF